MQQARANGIWKAGSDSEMRYENRLYIVK